MVHLMIIIVLMFLSFANCQELKLVNNNRSLQQDYQSFKSEILITISGIEIKLDSVYFTCENPREMQDCDDIKNQGNLKSGKYDVCFLGKVISIFCDFETPDGPYLVFQRRMDGSTNFFRSFVSYANGFGDLTKEFWLGLETIHKYTTNRKYSLRVDLEDYEWSKRYATYLNFSVSSASSNYTLYVDLYNGNAGDSMIGHNTMPFSTYDREHNPVEKCAKTFLGAWWYNSCHSSNLNGMYLEGPTDQYARGVVWGNWHGFYYSLKMTEMKLKRK